MQAYQAALARVIKKKKSSAGSAHVVDLGTGSGLLAVMAAKAGADTVVACDLHGSLCNTARKVRCSILWDRPESFPSMLHDSMLPMDGSATEYPMYGYIRSVLNLQCYA